MNMESVGSNKPFEAIGAITPSGTEKAGGEPFKMAQPSLSSPVSKAATTAKLEIKGGFTKLFNAIANSLKSIVSFLTDPKPLAAIHLKITETPPKEQSVAKKAVKEKPAKPEVGPEKPSKREVGPEKPLTKAEIKLMKKQERDLQKAFNQINVGYSPSSRRTAAPPPMKTTFGIQAFLQPFDANPLEEDEYLF
jgi:hypothetical protein